LSRENRFLTKMKSVIILALLKASLTNTGRVLIQQLNDGIQRLAGNSQQLQFLFIESEVKNEARSVSVVSRNGPNPVRAKLNPQATQPTTIDELHLKEFLESKDAIISAQGAATAFTFPVWTDNPALQALSYFETNDEEVDVHRLIMGSLSETSGDKLFYTPSYIEILHELIHAQHNAMGKNHERIKLQGTTQQVNVFFAIIGHYDNAEEFLTITGHTLSENAFYRELRMPLRINHQGFPFTTIFDLAFFDTLIFKTFSNPLFKNPTRSPLPPPLPSAAPPPP